MIDLQQVIEDVFNAATLSQKGSPTTLTQLVMAQVALEDERDALKQALPTYVSHVTSNMRNVAKHAPLPAPPPARVVQTSTGKSIKPASQKAQSRYGKSVQSRINSFLNFHMGFAKVQALNATSVHWGIERDGFYALSTGNQAEGDWCEAVRKEVVAHNVKTTAGLPQAVIQALIQQKPTTRSKRRPAQTASITQIASTTKAQQATQARRAAKLPKTGTTP